MKNVLSIIIPCYNCEDTISIALDSISNLKNVEIILINDGSTDNTKNIIDKYLSKNTNIKYLFQENKGPGSARNKGINCATGNYIMFLDSDDYIVSENLEEIINLYLLKEKHDIVYYNFQQVSESGQIYKTYNIDKFQKLSKKELIKNTISWNLPWGQFKIIKTNIIKENLIYFEENINNVEELFFTINVLNNSKNIFFYDKVVYKYLKRADSISRSTKIDESIYTMNFVFNKLCKQYERTEYINEFYNYYIISKIHLLKDLVNNKDFNTFKNICKEVRKDKRNIEINYISMRYKIILVFINLRLTLLLYFCLDLYF